MLGPKTMERETGVILLSTGEGEYIVKKVTSCSDRKLSSPLNSSVHVYHSLTLST